MNNMEINKERSVAIIIPVYNAQEYIADCLDSILAQTYPYWTVYCVNDGSQDNTSAILADYAEKDQRIKVYNKINGGAARARNYALNKLENEEWISFVDADDYIGKTMYESIFSAIEEEVVDYVRLFNQQTSARYDAQKINSASCNELKAKLVSCEQYFTTEAVGGFMSSIFVKSSVVTKNNIRFQENMKILEDQAFSIKCATYAKNVLILEKPKDYYYYSANESSVTRNAKDISDDIIRCLNIVYTAFLATESSTILNDYYYSKYLPAKLDTLFGCRLRYRKILNEKLLPEIKISQSRLSLKAKMKYILVRILKLL